nr:protein SIEVE ELEMENT OCCLUSION B-like isoform X2 [Ipomoea trifida]
MGLDEFEGDGVLLLISSGKHFPYYAYYAEECTGVQTIWVPITNDVDEDIQMPDSSYDYYRVLDLQSGIAPAFFRFLQDKCFPTFQVGGDPIVISLDKRGRLVHSNALHMIFTWGNQRSERKTMRSGDIILSLENELRERTSGADRVIDDIDKQIHNFAREVNKKINDWVDDIKAKMKSSIDDDKYIFLCGGNNIKRVLEFVLKIQEVRSEFQMNMKIAYVGRRRKMIEELDRAFDYVFHLGDVKCFWARLYSMTSSRIQYLNKVGLDEGSDEILQGLRKLLSYEDECTTIESWALLGKGKRIIACDVGDKMLGALNKYEKWKNNAHANDFEQTRQAREKIVDWVDNIEAKMKSSIDDEKYIFLCGGNNIKRVLEFVLKVDEKIIIEQVKDTHNPNGGIDVDANSLLKLLEGIFTLNTDSKSAEDNSEKEDETSNENPESSDEDNSENEDEFSNEDSESDEDNPENEDESSNDDSKRDEDDPEEEGSDEHGKPETTRSMGLDEFEGKGVLLLISSGKHFPYYAYYAQHTGVDKIWVPITNDVDEDIQMPDPFYSYYLVLDLQSGIAPAFLRFLQDKCFPTFQVGGDPIVISLDKRGRLVHSNALHMIFTWGIQLSERKTMRSGDIIPSLENALRERTSGADRVIDDLDKQIHNFAREVNKKINDWVDDIEAKMKSSFRSYNYTREREQELWIKGSWNLNLVARLSHHCSFELWLNDWIDDDEYIFLCGGNNIKRVLEFVLKVQEVRSEFQMNMKIAYVGRRRKMIEELDRAFDYVFNLGDVKFFWARLYSMTSSRIQYLNKVGLDEGSDEILQGLRKLLSYEDECTTIESWALLGKGKRIIACDVGDKMLGALNEYEKWKNNAHANDFEQAFKDCYEMLNTSSSSSSHQHSCCALNYSSNLDQVPEVESCPQCDQNMHKFVTFSCCHGPTNYLYSEQDSDSD